ncbi:helix-turn-helix domain-containing protein [Sphingomonas sp. PB2P12]|uniref:helix-turn-helix domain-containing protein n=1 Tax=Sphingomonas sandaracina TaxID=3096157 RepID=UPI002FC6A5C6
MDPITVTIENAKTALGIGHTTIYRLIGEGRLQTVKLGRRTLVKTDSIRQLVATLEAA